MHFKVAVFSRKDQSFADLLAPFQENTGYCPEEFLEFEDMTDIIISEYVEEGSDIRERYSSIEEFAYQDYGCRKDDKTGRFGFYQNPNGKWDWYQLGGRWPGELILKKGTEGISAPGSKKFDKSAYFPFKGHKRVDSALIKDIDWEKIKEAKVENANKAWDEIQEKINSEDSHYLMIMFGYKEGMSKQDYVDEHSKFYIHSVVTSCGEWVEEDWGDESFYDKFIAEEYPELRISIVDCHI